MKPASEIADTVVIKRPTLPTPPGGTPGDEPVRGQGIVSKKLRARPDDEYVSAGGYVWLPRYIKALPFYIDDLSRDFGDDIYERMLLDSQVQACINVRKSAVLAQGLELIAVQDIELPAPSTKPATTKGFVKRVVDRVRRWFFGTETDAHAKTVPAASALSEEIAAFCRWNVERLQGRSFAAVMFELLDGIAFGHKMAEQIYALQDTGEWEGKLALRALKVKPRRSTAFVVDVYFNIIGIMGLIPGQGAPVIVEQIIGEPSQIPNMLPRDKFACFIHRMRDANPQGTSDLRCVYEPWWLKRQVWGNYLAYLAVFAGGRLIGYTAEKATAVIETDDEGNPTGSLVTPEQSMAVALSESVAGGVSAFPHGAKVEQFLPPDTESPYNKAIDMADRQIAKGILYQTLATEEGEHMTRAASSTHQDILGLLVRSDKQELRDFIRNDILKPLVRYNYGDDAAENLVPMVSLGDTEDQDFATTATAIAALQSSGFFNWTQLPAIDQMLGLPPRDMDAVMEEMKQQQVAATKAAPSSSEKVTTNAKP